MRRALILTAAGVGLLLVAGAARAARTGRGAMSQYDAIYQEHGAAFGVDWRLVKAVAQHESGENAAAVNARDNESIGLMQILCRPDGRGGCANKLYVTGWSGVTRAALLVPEHNVFIGTQILAENIRAYGVPKGISVYNAWSQHAAPAAGPFTNQKYVDDVLRRAAALGWTPV